MTFTFNSDTISTDTLTFNISTGPEFAYLQLVSQTANLTLQADTVDKTQIWQNESQGLLMTRVFTNSRYTEYRFVYAKMGGIDDFDIIFTKDVAGIYNYRLRSLNDTFIWNINSKEWQLENKVWNFSEIISDDVLSQGVIKIKNVKPYEAPRRKTYQSSNETGQGYVFLTNNSI
jgi:hypothetical protein